jgi:hypothetical protein
LCIQVCDGSNLCATATITINVIPVNDPPLISGTTTSTLVDTPVDICLPASDPDGDPITVTVCGPPVHGDITTPTYSDGKVCFTYTPDAGYTGTDELCISVCDDKLACATASVTINVNPACVQIEAWVYLEGSAVDAGGSASYNLPMRTDLNNLRILPGQTMVDEWLGNYTTPKGQPYNKSPWYYFGNEGDSFDSGGDPTKADAGYPATVTDWVLVSLRDTPEGTGGPLCRKAALLHNDGHIQFLNGGFDCCTLDMNKKYYLVVEHRNHLIVMSHEPISIVNGKVSYDFRIQQSYVLVDGGWGTDAYARQKEILPGKFAMFAGNGKQDETSNSDTDINFDDRTYWEMQNGVFGRYLNGDYNMNGDCNFNDRILWEFNNGKFTSVPRN